ARVRPGRQGRLLLPERAEVQDAVRDVRLQRRGEPRRRRPVADRLRAEGVDRRRGGQDRRAREESGELRRVSFRPEPDDGITIPRKSRRNGMRTALVTLFCALGLVASGGSGPRADDKADVEKELKKFHGVWTFESVEAGGKTL